MIPTMRATIDRMGRIVIPKGIRDRLELRGGETLEIVERNGVIELSPVPTDIRLVDTPEGPVAEPITDIPPLTDEQVRDTLERIRR